MTDIKQIDNQELLSRLKVGREKLNLASIELKKHFVGLDNIIDNIIKDIEVWYCLPEIIQRPQIICLWGLTGVGKTDLIRRLVNILEFNDRYLEVQLTTKDGIYDSQSSLERLMGEADVDSGQPAVLLLDEIQRFRSIDDHGEEIFDYKFQDVWTLLSDGRFSIKLDLRAHILEMLYRSMYYADARENGEDDDIIPGLKSNKKKRVKKVEIKKREYHTGYWEAQDIKRMLNLDLSLPEIMKWDASRVLEETEKRLQDKSTYTGKDYSKLLIFISGNIDEAYSMSGKIADADWDADVFHEHSKRITFVDIKRALSQRFTPEQVARFGNTHILYPSLSVESYREITRRNLDRVCGAAYEHTGVRILYDDSVVDVLYRNGIFPAQGVRPLFSTINSMFESILPYFIITALEKGAPEVHISYNNGVHSFDCKIMQEVESIFNHGDLDKIRDKQQDDIYSIAVHESGHAVVYALLFGLAPTQIAVSLTGSEDAGFTGVHKMNFTKKSALDNICVGLAGTVSETLVIGEGNEDLGCYGDISKATKEASKLVRQCGMYSNVAETYNRNACSGLATAENLCQDNMESSMLIEEIMKKEKDRATKLLSENRELLDNVIKSLVEEKVLMPSVFSKICEKYGVKAEVASAQRVVKTKKDFNNNLGKYKIRRW